VDAEYYFPGSLSHGFPGLELPFEA
jgi:hypothetical protein